MMKNKKPLMILCAVVLLAAGAAIGAYAASNFGTQDDPLVAKSYLDDVLAPQLQAQYEAQLDQKFAALDDKIISVADSVKGNFSAVTLSSGQTLTADPGCEIILRSGTVTAVGSLSDVTDGAALSQGSALMANHLCVVGTSDSGVTASEEATLLVRGIHSVY